MKYVEGRVRTLNVRDKKFWSPKPAVWSIGKLWYLPDKEQSMGPLGTGADYRHETVNEARNMKE